MTSGTPQPPDESTPDTAEVVTESSPVDPGRGTGFGVVALVLGGLGGVLPFLPVDLGDARAWLPLPFALPGVVVGIMGCTGIRRGNAWAIAGSILCVIAVGLSTVALGFSPDTKDNSRIGEDHTLEILRDELDVRLGERYVDVETGIVSVTVTLYNKGPDAASYSVSIVVDTGEESCDFGASAHNLVPGASYQDQVTSCSQQVPVMDVSFQVTSVSKS